MEYEQRVRVTTPEGVDLELTVAGMGSRLIGATLDLLVQSVLAVALILLSTAILPSGGLEVAALSIIGFAILFGYDIGFEVLAQGRTPGKRWAGLRVVRFSGAPVTLPVSAIRNILRIVDILPGVYGIGVIAIFLTRHNQRLGDIAAGTFVTRERLGGLGRGRRDLDRELPLPNLPPGLDASAVTVEELSTVRQFLERREELEPDAASRIAMELADRLGPKVAGAPSGLPAHKFLELVVAAKLAQR